MSSPFSLSPTNRITRQSARARTIYADTTPVSSGNFPRGADELLKSVVAEERRQRAIEDYQKGIDFETFLLLRIASETTGGDQGGAEGNSKRQLALSTDRLINLISEQVRTMLCFVTVGTTQFDELVSAVLDEIVLTELRNQLHVDRLLVQFGNGRVPPTKFEFHESDKEAKSYWSKTANGIEIRLQRYLSDFADELRRADLVISHAGAGSCLETLELQKPLIVVINDALAENHQTELAERLAADEHLLYTTPGRLVDLLANKSATLQTLKPFPRADPKVFRDFFSHFIRSNKA